ncbi:MAG: hypothetical protein DMG70_33540 [Acidobacteria bacterium]|nr:MAG: hypothetical protein DMG70_33540 [Acidobacteriota bacterium]
MLWVPKVHADLSRCAAGRRYNPDPDIAVGFGIHAIAYSSKFRRRRCYCHVFATLQPGARNSFSNLQYISIFAEQ